MTPPSTRPSDLECGMCGLRYAAGTSAGLCTCGRPLLARYEHPEQAPLDWPDRLKNREASLWRYRERLPDVKRVVTLGEGFTPLMEAPDSVRSQLDVASLRFKWEGDNPTGSFKARGMALAISSAWHLGSRRFVVPTAGNAGVAAAAYVQAAGGELDVFMPADSDPTFFDAVSGYGARLHRIDGLISDCGREAQRCKGEGAWDLSTLKEPYRLEGKKTMGFELWEQLDGALPDVIVYPTGGGTGLVGMWKAFGELQDAGLLAGPRPRMVSVQMAGCAPMVRAFHSGQETATPWQDATTDVSGLRVPGAVGDFLILRALRESDGTAVEVQEDRAFQETAMLNTELRLDGAPETGAAWAGCAELRRTGWIRATDRVVVFLTGSGAMYRNILVRHGVTSYFDESTPAA